MENFTGETCSNCGSMKFKNREDLSDDEKFVVERLPKSSEFLLEQEKKQRFCKRCLFPSEKRNVLA